MGMHNMVPSPPGLRHTLLTGLGGLLYILGGICAVTGLAWWAYLFLVSQFFPGASWDGLGADIVWWIISLVALFGLGRLSYAWASP